MDKTWGNFTQIKSTALQLCKSMQPRYWMLLGTSGSATTMRPGRMEVRRHSWATGSGPVASQPMTSPVASKWGYTYTADWQVQAKHHEIKEHSLPVLQRQWAETSEQLGGHLDLYQIHSATFDSGVLDNVGVLTELARLKADGIAIGLTLSGPDQAQVLERAMAVEIDGVPVFDAVQATWNLLDRSVGTTLAQASHNGLFVVAKEALANGRLTERNEDPAFADRLMLLRQEADRLGATVDALALAAVLAQPWVDVVLSGAATVDQVASNVKALDVAWDEAATQSLSPLTEPAKQYWQTRSDLAWN